MNRTAIQDWVLRRRTGEEFKKEYVLGFLFNPRGDIVWLIRKARPEWQAGFFNGIGGKVEVGEVPLHAMVREFAEETGVLLEGADWTPFCIMEGTDFIVHCFKAFNEAVPQTITDETVASESVWKLNQIPLIPNVNWLVPLALDPERSTAHVWTYLPGSGKKQ